MSNRNASVGQQVNGSWRIKEMSPAEKNLTEKNLLPRIPLLISVHNQKIISLLEIFQLISQFEIKFLN